MRSAPARALGWSLGVHGVRVLIIVTGAYAAPLLGITGWWIGLFVNVLCTIFALLVVGRSGLLGSIGLGILPPRRGAVWVLLPVLGVALAWLLPDGLRGDPPGLALWCVTLLLVGVNEELVSRGAVLERLRGAFAPVPACCLSAALFGWQHVSLLVTTDRGTADVLTTVLFASTQGFLFAAFQLRYRWILPLILLHAFSDLTAILGADPLPTGVLAAVGAGYVIGGAMLLRRRAGDRSPGEARQHHDERRGRGPAAGRLPGAR